MFPFWKKNRLYYCTAIILNSTIAAVFTWMDYWMGLPGTGPEAQGVRGPWASPEKYHCKRITARDHKEMQNDHKMIQKDHKDTQNDQRHTIPPQRDTKWPQTTSLSVWVSCSYIVVGGLLLYMSHVTWTFVNEAQNNLSRFYRQDSDLEAGKPGPWSLLFRIYVWLNI